MTSLSIVVGGVVGRVALAEVLVERLAPDDAQVDERAHLLDERALGLLHVARDHHRGQGVQDGVAVSGQRGVLGLVQDDGLGLVAGDEGGDRDADGYEYDDGDGELPLDRDVSKLHGTTSSHCVVSPLCLVYAGRGREVNVNLHLEGACQ